MNKILLAQRTAVFDASPRAVWNVMTDNGDVSWRSDLSGVRGTGEGKWIEIDNRGRETRFEVRFFDPYRFYSFCMENKYFTGIWSATFSPAESGGTMVELRQEIAVKNPVMAVIARHFWNLEKLEETYVRDLRRKLGEEK